MPKVSKTIIHKRAVIRGATGEPIPETLSDMLKQAYEHPAGRNVEGRCNPSGDETLAINYHSTAHTDLFGGSLEVGTFICFDAAKSALCVQLDRDAEVFSVLPAPPDANNAFLENQMYFAVWGNDMAFITGGLTLKDFNEYLNWLFVTRLNILSEVCDIDFEDIAIPEQQEHAKSLDLNLFAHVISKNERLFLDGNAMHFLPIFPTDMIYGDKVSADTKFTVKISITATNRKKFLEDGEFDMLDDIAHSFRKKNDASYAITTQNGMILSNHKSFKVFKDVSIEADDNKILQMHDVWNEMKDFINRVLNMEAEYAKLKEAA